MLGLINKIFVYTYTWHYEKNNKNPDIDPTRIASWILGLSIGLWLISINCASSFIFKYDFKSMYFIIGIPSLSLIAGGLFNTYYIAKNRGLDLYIEYKSSSNVKSPIKGIVLVILFMLFPLILLALFIVLFDVLSR
jgi:general stress protein CsbA